MANVIKLRKGLDIHLAGKAGETDMTLKPGAAFAVSPGSFPGLTPKVAVREGDRVLAGDALFVNKKCPEVRYASPVSGVVKAVVRGDRRKLLSVAIEADKATEYRDFGVKDPARLSGGQVRQALLEAGLFGYIDQLPYAVSATPGAEPKAIFVSALRDKPLAASFEYELKGQEQDFQTGLTALSRMAKTYLSIGARQTAEALTSARDVELTVMDGPCPAGNVGVQVNHLDPVNKGETVWTIGDPTVVLFIGRLFSKGRVDLTRKVALCGSEVLKPCYADMLVGQELSTLVAGSYDASHHVRIIDGNVLTGTPTTKEGHLGAHTSEVTIIPEGDDADELAGWIMPRLRQFSTSRSYFSWLLGKRDYKLDARVKGGQRHMIMSGEYARVMPMDICPEHLVKAIIAGDIDKMEQLGIYEVAPEDFALAEFADSSKLELQRIVREGLDMLCKENS